MEFFVVVSLVKFLLAASWFVVVQSVEVVVVQSVRASSLFALTVVHRTNISLVTVQTFTSTLAAAAHH